MTVEILQLQTEKFGMVLQAAPVVVEHVQPTHRLTFARDDSWRPKPPLERPRPDVTQRENVRNLANESLLSGDSRMRSHCCRLWRQSSRRLKST